MRNAPSRPLNSRLAGTTSSRAVASMNPAPSAMKYFRYRRSQCRWTMMVPPNTFAIAAVRPSSRLVVIGCMRICKPNRRNGRLSDFLARCLPLLARTKYRYVLHQLVADLDAVVPYSRTHFLVVSDSKQGGSPVTQEEKRVKGLGIFLRLAAEARGQLG